MQRPLPVVQLRTFRSVDEPVLAAIFTDAQTLRWNAGPATDSIAAWWRSANEVDPTSATWAVADPRDDRLLGTISVFAVNTDQQTAEIGYRVAPAERGRGVASAALEAASRKAFGELGLHRIQLFHAAANAASCVVATRSGYVLEGTLRQSYRYGDGNRYDEHLHARLRISDL